MKTVLTIAGSDCSGGAGIQADLKTMAAHGVYGMSAIAALTAQNTTGVAGIYHVSRDFLEQQLDCIFTDIYPDAVKIGMVSEKELIEGIAGKLKQYGAKKYCPGPGYGVYQRQQAVKRGCHRDLKGGAVSAG
nr:bifunctional hydroxymethylpyrimidine kinase/phosphomethylpyrimidine kinase [Anaerostipes caccae]